MKLELTLLEPYRIVKWHPCGSRNQLSFLRGYGFARWHKKQNSNLGFPFFPGTLVRAMVIKAAETLLCMHNGVYNGIACCPGQFEGGRGRVVAKGDQLTARRLRRRATYTWDSEMCPTNASDPCPFCLLLGRCHDNKPGSLNKGLDVNFTNFGPLPGEDGKPALTKLADIATPRVLNRIDQHTGKAEDFYNALEINATGHNRFIGTLEFSERAAVNADLIRLISDAAALVDCIAGSLCCLTVVDAKPAPKTEEAESSSDYIERSSENAVEQKKDDSPIAQEARKICDAFDNAGKMVHLRTFADVVRDLRRFVPENLSFPKGHRDRLGRTTDHYIWDAIRIDRKPLRERLIARYRTLNKDGQIDWRTYCEQLGQKLYLASKSGETDFSGIKRPLSSVPMIRRAVEDQIVSRYSTQPPAYEFLITADLVAQTPFFFGWNRESLESDLASMPILVTPDGRFRIPRTSLRGVLRRDLQLAADSPCRAELARRVPCQCPVCSLLQLITLKDACAGNRAPRMRHRTRINPHSGIVVDGALFDTEVGPPETSFPFELRVRSPFAALPETLQTVLAWWQQGNAFLSGSAATGKGRFALKNIKYRQWDLCNDFEGYKNTLGGRKQPPIKFEPLVLPPPAKPYCWGESIPVTLCINTPFITNDPLAALTDAEGADSIPYRDTIASASETEQERLVYKAESLRGLLRTFVAYEAGQPELLIKNHDDCTCLLCESFGNEHEAGKIRVEDALPTVEHGDKKIDRIAIDRFTGGAADKRKFDLLPVVATPYRPLKLEGSVRLHADIKSSVRKTIEDAIARLQTGAYTLGGFGNSGYGWLNYQPQNDDSMQHVSFEGLSLSAQADFQPEAKTYWPHCFLPFGPSVKRENEPPSHLTAGKAGFSGKLVCTLKTLTPLIVPDSGVARDEDENGGNTHREMNFFRLDNTPCIPGSEIKGAVSAVFEALSNSCLRVFDERHRLSWRMPAENLAEWIPGRVVENNGKFKVCVMEEYRLPTYDNQTLRSRIVAEGKKGYYSSGFKAQPTRVESLMLENASEIRKRLVKQPDIQMGKKTVQVFAYAPNKVDNIALLVKSPNRAHDKAARGVRIGFIKVAGPNKVEIRKKTTADNTVPGLISNWAEAEHNNVILEDNQHGRKRAFPKYIGHDTETVYTMEKRCERVFVKPRKSISYPVPKSVEEKFHQLCMEYRRNSTHIPEIFRTRLPDGGKINDGDLIYFRHDGHRVTDIIPVRISRIVDDEVVTQKLRDDLRPCVREIIDEEAAQKINKDGLKVLFSA